jgi:hypothetical protein
VHDVVFAQEAAQKAREAESAKARERERKAAEAAKADRERKATADAERKAAAAEAERERKAADAAKKAAADKAERERVERERRDNERRAKEAAAAAASASTSDDVDGGGGGADGDDDLRAIVETLADLPLQLDDCLLQISDGGADVNVPAGATVDSMMERLEKLASGVGKAARNVQKVAKAKQMEQPVRMAIPHAAKACSHIVTVAKALASLANHNLDDQIMILDTVRGFLALVERLASAASAALAKPLDMALRKNMLAAADAVIAGVR